MFWKETAEKLFKDQLEQGQGGGLVEKDARDASLFLINVSIEPEDKVTFRLTYDELLKRKVGLYEYVLHIQPGQVVDDFKCR